jgi:hypothetical protein
MSILNEDLYKQKYDYNTLKTNIYAVSLLDILKTQVLTKEFCVKYILNTDYQLSVEETCINEWIVKKYQPHLQNIKLTCDNKKNNLKRVDSFEDFESFANR